MQTAMFSSEITVGWLLVHTWSNRVLSSLHLSKFPENLTQQLSLLVTKSWKHVSISIKQKHLSGRV